MSDSSNDGTKEHIEFAILAIEIVMAFAVGFFISYKAKLELDKRIEESRLKDEEHIKVLDAQQNPI